MDSITQIDIDLARRPVENLGALGPSLVGMEGSILLAAVGLCFRNPKPDDLAAQSADQQFAHQVLRHDGTLPVKKSLL